MTSTLLMKSLFILYCIIGALALYEQNYPRALYWVGAGVITISVLWGTKT